MMRPDVVDDVDDRATPPDLFAALHARFQFTVDAAASPLNAKLARYWTREQNGLDQPWRGERVWCNPPYSNIAPWVRKAWESPGARLVVLLLPNNRCEQPWWQHMVEPFRDRPGSPLTVEFLPGRPRFAQPTQTVTVTGRPPFGVLLLIWRWADGPKMEPRLWRDDLLEDSDG